MGLNDYFWRNIDKWEELEQDEEPEWLEQMIDAMEGDK